MDSKEKKRTMKRIRRIIVVVILCAVVLFVSYSCYTSSRLTKYPKGIGGYEDTTFYSNDGGMVAFTEKHAWYFTEEQGIILLTLAGYEDGVIKMTRDEKEFYFIAVDNDTLYDEQTKKIFTKGVRYG